LRNRRGQKRSVHASDEVVDFVLAVSEVTSLDEVVVHAAVTTSGGRQLEGPEKVVSPLEVRSNRVDFVDEIFNRLDSEVAEGSLNDSVIGEGNSLAVDLSVSALVHQFANGLDVGVAPGDVRQNLGSRLV